MKILSTITLICLSLFAPHSQAQIGGFLKDLKSLADKAAQTPAQKQIPVPAPDFKQPNQEIEKSLTQPTSQIAPASEKNAAPIVSTVNPKITPPVINPVPQFRAIWCKSIDPSANGPIDYKGVSVGDLCQAPDDLIATVFDKLKTNKQSFEWMVTPNALKEGTSILVEHIIAGDKTFKLIALIINPFKEKAYIGSFTGLICAADASNNLNAGNPFRKALESKYGVPASAYTEYDQIKAQIDDLEAMVARSKSQAISVREAKDARDADNMLNSLRPMRAAANKNIILSLTWDYEKGNKFRPIGSAVVEQANPNDLRDTGGCPIKTLQGRSFEQNFGFMISVTGSKKISTIAEELDAANRAKQIEKVQSAPAPKF